MHQKTRTPGVMAVTKMMICFGCSRRRLLALSDLLRCLYLRRCSGKILTLRQMRNLWPLAFRRAGDRWPRQLDRALTRAQQAAMPMLVIAPIVPRTASYEDSSAAPGLGVIRNRQPSEIIWRRPRTFRRSTSAPGLGG